MDELQALQPAGQPNLHPGREDGEEGKAPGQEGDSEARWQPRLEAELAEYAAVDCILFRKVSHQYNACARVTGQERLRSAWQYQFGHEALEVTP